MNIFNKLKNKFSSFTEKEPENKFETLHNEVHIDKIEQSVNNIDYCKRCHSYTNINRFGYCEQCSIIKNYIEKSTTQESLMNNKSSYVLDLHNKIKTLTAFDYNKLDIENAEKVDSLNGLEKKFIEYLDAKCVDDFDLAEYWIYQHFIDCNYLISKLIKNGYIEISENRNLSALNTDELKTILKNADLKINGTKVELIKRIEENLPQDIINSMIKNGKKYFILTDKSNGIKEKSSNSLAKDIDFEEKCYNLVLENKLKEAYNLVGEYENRKLVKRGVNCDWNNPQREFYLYINSPLPFKLPECLSKYETELKATAIYSEMMGVNPANAIGFFVHKYKINVDREIISSILNALFSIAQGVILTNERISMIENIEAELQRTKNTPKSNFESLSIDKFYDTLKQKIKEAGFDSKNLSFDQLKDGTYNFMYEDFQIGRAKFGKRSSNMQIITNNDVIWLKNETMEIYISNIDKWIDYIKKQAKRT